MLISVIGKSGAGKSTIINKLITLNSSTRYSDINKVGHYVNDLSVIQEELIKTSEPR